MKPVAIAFLLACCLGLSGCATPGTPGYSLSFGSYDGARHTHWGSLAYDSRVYGAPSFLDPSTGIEYARRFGRRGIYYAPVLDPPAPAAPPPYRYTFPKGYDHDWRHWHDYGRHPPITRPSK